MNKEHRPLTFVQAINEGIRTRMREDDSTIVMGIDVAGAAGKAEEGFIDHFGGTFAMTKGLIQEFGTSRVLDTPISETGFVGAGVGAAAAGLRPLVDMMFVGFIGVCGDQIFNNMAKMHYMFGGKVTLPITIQAQTAASGGNAAQHSETLYSIFAHFPGLKCVVPSDPYSAKGIQIAAMKDDDPVVVFQSTRLMGVNFDQHVPEESYELPIGKSRIVRSGYDVTLIGIGTTTRTCLQSAESLAKQGYQAEVVDLLSISPLDEDTILSSISKTRKVVIVDEDYPKCSVASELAALSAEKAFDLLDAPPRRVTAPHAPIPYASVIEQLHFPSVEMVTAACLEVIS